MKQHRDGEDPNFCHIGPKQVNNRVCYYWYIQKKQRVKQTLISNHNGTNNKDSLGLQD